MNEERERTPHSKLSGIRSRLLKIRTHLFRTWPLLVGLATAFVGSYVFMALNPAPDPLTEEDVDTLIVDAMASATPRAAFSADVYQIILPSLVLISTENENATNPDEGFGIGTGVVVSDNADILTAYHVVDGATKIDISFADGTRTTAVISSAEPENDIAVLTPERLPELLVPAVLGNANGMRIGDEAYAVGNPLGLTASMSSGVISGFNRTLPIDENGIQLEGLIQFDTAVNPGNSGGPLLNRYGQVIGIVTALANPSEQNFFIGIGFAVPISTAGGAAGAPQY